MLRHHRSATGPRRRLHVVAGLILVLALTLAACSSADQASMDAGVSSAEGGGEPSRAPMEEAAEDMAEEWAAGDDTADGPVPVGASTGRAVVRTATLHLRARDTAQLTERAVALVEQSGGYVAGTDLSRTAEGVVAGSLTLRVPSALLQETLDALDELADAVLERRLDEVDVTTQLSDLDAEIANLTAYETELRALLSEVREATSETEDLLRVFDRVTEVRGRIDQANARRAVLGDQVAMATIHLRVSPSPSSGPVTDPGWSPGDTARTALATTMRILSEIADALIRIGLTILPVTLVLVGPVALVVWLTLRWRRRRTAERTTAPATTGPATAPAPPTAPGQGHGPEVPPAG